MIVQFLEASVKEKDHKAVKKKIVTRYNKEKNKAEKNPFSNEIHSLISAWHYTFTMTYIVKYV